VTSVGCLSSEEEVLSNRTRITGGQPQSDHITKKEVLRIVKGLVEHYDSKIEELSRKLDEAGCLKVHQKNNDAVSTKQASSFVVPQSARTVKLSSTQSKKAISPRDTK